ncbi:MAG: bifunctional phosphopantothenoylcysteine decarboxylase/phosphopantothenate--cysteine ligase CoaBC [Actinomycetaceae bacterium]|nr:bifunctional phosphopantothenoylcysteine decarboxylase/phosphopantothenate--cysteine ligase CoaBC [Actinomycetaceae bacterium]MDY6083168.1 bifunctional phosphopantothenoylcysteine decarboxylase/phosphopantothenate--cysteine ligase CoaBC [Actinomycetaceae bacterium]
MEEWLPADLAGKHVVVGVSGGIAAYKACEIVRSFQRAGADVRVIPTAESLHFVGQATWEGLTGHRVLVDVFDGAADVAHVAYGKEADLLVIAPATAHTIAKLAHGYADDLLSTTFLVATCPKAVAPAMHTQMWLNPATHDNIALLENRGVAIIGPASGHLTSGDTGAGRMEDPHVIAARSASLLHDQDLAGLRVVISAGGTREALDPVRYIGNRSSGLMGVNLALNALSRGAQVTLIAGAMSLQAQQMAEGLHVIPIESAAQLQQEMTREAMRADIAVMAAAVADFRSQATAASKIKKQVNSDGSGAGLTLHLTENPDILRALAIEKPPTLTLVGFAAETGDEHTSALEYGKQKARRKGADLMMINRVGDGQGFGDVETTVTAVDAQGRECAHVTGSKKHVAQWILSQAAQWRKEHLPQASL